MSVAVEPSLRIDRRLDRLRREVGSAFPALLDALGAEIATQAQRRIREEQSGPDGEEWPPWSERYAARRRGRGGSLLLRDGHLDDSLQHFVRPAGDEVVVGSTLVYAATHQFGDPDRGIPARPFLGFSPANEDDLEAVLADWMERVGREASSA